MFAAMLVLALAMILVLLVMLKFVLLCSFCLVNR